MELKSKNSNSRLYFNTNNNLLKYKRSQVAIFIIIAILLVAAIVIVYLLWKPPTTRPDVSDPELYIKECMKDSVKEAVSILPKQGGSIKPELTIMYKGDNFTYLCYNQGFYNPCINQRPLLIEYEEKEIGDYIEEEVNKCFTDLKDGLEGKGYDVYMGDMKIKTELQSKRVIVDAERKLTITKGGATKSFNGFEVKVATPLYELSEIAMEIVNQEAQFCNFENLGFMIIYPAYDIRKDNVDGSLLYKVKELESQQEFKFAVRGCVMPAGL